MGRLVSSSVQSPVTVVALAPATAAGQTATGEVQSDRLQRGRTGPTAWLPMVVRHQAARRPTNGNVRGPASYQHDLDGDRAVYVRKITAQRLGHGGRPTVLDVLPARADPQGAARPDQRRHAQGFAEGLDRLPVQRQGQAVGPTAGHVDAEQRRPVHGTNYGSQAGAGPVQAGGGRQRRRRRSSRSWATSAGLGRGDAGHGGRQPAAGRTCPTDPLGYEAVDAVALARRRPGQARRRRGARVRRPCRTTSASAGNWSSPSRRSEWQQTAVVRRHAAGGRAPASASEAKDFEPLRSMAVVARHQRTASGRRHPLRPGRVGEGPARPCPDGSRANARPGAVVERLDRLDGRRWQGRRWPRTAVPTPYLARRARGPGAGDVGWPSR